MHARVHATAVRAPAVVGLIVLFAVASGSIGLLAAGERCVDCASCEDGRCTEDSFSSHHHCCASSCLGHTSIATPIAFFAAAPLIARSIQQGTGVAVLDRAPDTPYHPPRA